MTDLRVEQVDADAFAEAVDELAALLVDAVASGASVGFLPPFGEKDAAAWWRSLGPDVAAGRTILIAARSGPTLVGTAQLRLAQLPNSRHRAEVAKVIVRGDARRAGVGTRLMRAVDEVARAHARSLLVLDTLTDSDAERFYAALGWARSGVIPSYARVPDGSLRATTVFYKLL